MEQGRVGAGTVHFDGRVADQQVQRPRDGPAEEAVPEGEPAGDRVRISTHPRISRGER